MNMLLSYRLTFMLILFISITNTMEDEFPFFEENTIDQNIQKYIDAMSAFETNPCQFDDMSALLPILTIKDENTSPKMYNNHCSTTAPEEDEKKSMPWYILENNGSSSAYLNNEQFLGIEEKPSFSIKNEEESNKKRKRVARKSSHEKRRKKPTIRKNEFKKFCTRLSNRKKRRDLQVGDIPCPYTGCTTIRTSNELLELHINHKHQRTNSIICDTCGGSFYHSKIFDLHKAFNVCTPK